MTLARVCGAFSSSHTLRPPTPPRTGVGSGRSGRGWARLPMASWLGPVTDNGSPGGVYDRRRQGSTFYPRARGLINKNSEKENTA